MLETFRDLLVVKTGGEMPSARAAVLVWFLTGLLAVGRAAPDLAREKLDVEVNVKAIVQRILSRYVLFAIS